MPSPAALLWASLAAFSSTMATRLSVGFAKRGDDDTGLTPDLTATTREKVLALCLQAAYSYELAIAAPSLTADDQHLLQHGQSVWQGPRVIVASGASAGERIVVAGVHKLTAGEKIKAIDQASAVSGSSDTALAK